MLLIDELDRDAAIEKLADRIALTVQIIYTQPPNAGEWASLTVEIRQWLNEAEAIKQADDTLARSEP